MKIETKFKVNDLVLYKYQQSDLDKISDCTTIMAAFEVIDVNTVTCMAGTQVFYDVRGITAMVSKDFKDRKSINCLVNYSFNKANPSDYHRLREDELKVAQNKIKDIFSELIK